MRPNSARDDRVRVILAAVDAIGMSFARAHLRSQTVHRKSVVLLTHDHVR